MTIHGSLFTEFKEKDTQDPFALQNKTAAHRHALWRGHGHVGRWSPIRATCAPKQSSVSRMFKAAVTGEA